MNAIQTGTSGTLDILGRGYLVAYGRHQSGCRVYLDERVGPTELPAWALGRLREKAAEIAERDARVRVRARARADSHANGTAEPPVRLDERGMLRWRGELVHRTVDGALDRSDSLFFLGLALAEAGASAATIVSALEARDTALGWNKYADRGDADTRYEEIAEKAVDYATNEGLRFTFSKNGTRNGTTAAAPTRGGEQPPDATALAAVVETFHRWLYIEDDAPLYAVLGTVAGNLLPGDPLWLMLVGPSSGGKTEALQAAVGLPYVRSVATVTESALLSGTPKKDAKGSKGGLLREIGSFGMLLVKDFTSILSMKHEVRTAVLAAFREIYDGSWQRNVGTDGGRTLTWSGKVGVVAACTTAIDSHHGVVSLMGERFVYLRLAELSRREQSRRALANLGREQAMRGELADAVTRLFAGLALPETFPEFSEDESARLASLASLVALGRSGVERDGRTREVELVHDSEAPARLVRALGRLYAGLLVLGLERDRAWSIVHRVGFDCLPKVRRAAFDFLLRQADWQPTPAIAKTIGLPTATVRRALEDLTAHHVVERRLAEKQGKPDSWRLTGGASTLYGETVSETSPSISSEGPGGADHPSKETENMEREFSETVGTDRPREAVCWSCKGPLSSESEDSCDRCGWLVCSCGRCSKDCSDSPPSDGYGTPVPRWRCACTSYEREQLSDGEWYCAGCRSRGVPSPEDRP